VFGVFDQHMLIGIAGLKQEPYAQLRHKGVLWGVFVHPLYRNVGVARELLGAALTHARTMRLMQIHLRASTENHRARRLYTSSGLAGMASSGSRIRSRASTSTKKPWCYIWMVSMPTHRCSHCDKR
jgi:ribosomal protein S18 acetylase RimI-like enzyme